MAIGDPYISWPQLKSVLGITDSSEDDLGNRAVLASARAINNRSGYTTFWKGSSPETIAIETEGRVRPVRRGANRYWKLLLPDGIASAVSFSVAGSSGATLFEADIQFRQKKPVTAVKIPWNVSIGETVSVTAYWGWPEVPDDIVMANQIQAHRFYGRRGSPEGIAGSAEWGLTRIPNLDPDVKSILEGGGYINPGIG
jgi:hypothetical protein